MFNSRSERSSLPFRAFHSCALLEAFSICSAAAALVGDFVDRWQIGPFGRVPSSSISPGSSIAWDTLRPLWRPRYLLPYAIPVERSSVTRAYAAAFPKPIVPRELSSSRSSEKGPVSGFPLDFQQPHGVLSHDQAPPPPLAAARRAVRLLSLQAELVHPMVDGHVLSALLVVVTRRSEVIDGSCPKAPTRAQSAGASRGCASRVPSWRFSPGPWWELWGMRRHRWPQNDGWLRPIGRRGHAHPPRDARAPPAKTKVSQLDERRREAVEALDLETRRREVAENRVESLKEALFRMSKEKKALEERLALGMQQHALVTEERSTGIAYGRRDRGLHNGRSVPQASTIPAKPTRRIPKGLIRHRSTRSPTRAAVAGQIKRASRTSTATARNGLTWFRLLRLYFAPTVPRQWPWVWPPTTPYPLPFRAVMVIAVSTRRVSYDAPLPWRVGNGTPFPAETARSGSRILGCRRRRLSPENGRFRAVLLPRSSVVDRWPR